MNDNNYYSLSGGLVSNINNMHEVVFKLQRQIKQKDNPQTLKIVIEKCKEDLKQAEATLAVFPTRIQDWSKRLDELEGERKKLEAEKSPTLHKVKEVCSNLLHLTGVLVGSAAIAGVAALVSSYAFS